jgi:hypothetical protein
MGIPGRGPHPLHVTGPPASGALSAAITITIIVTAVAPVAFAMIRCWLLPWLARRHWRRDMRHIHVRDGRRCASCGGRSTRLRKRHGQWQCRDGRLCALAQVYAAMLASL